VQALVRQRFGFRRVPVATAVVFTVTATTSVLQAVVPGMLADLGAAVVQLVPRWTVVAGRVVAVVAAGTAAALAAVRDIHGAAMLAGIAIAAMTR
jgi:hypothetical protein